MKTLTEGNSNPKTAKSLPFGYLTASLSLAPHDLAGGGTICPYSTPGCREVCIYEQGRGRMRRTKEARIAKPQRFLHDPIEFINRELVPDIATLCRKAERLGVAPAVRLNCTSDIAWEKYREHLMDDFGNVQFYDYTKNPYRVFKHFDGDKMPKNYHLTFSASEENLDWSLTLLGLGCTVALVTEQHYGVDSPLKHWYTHPTRDGDQHDLTFLHKPGSVLLLSPKGDAKKDETGFVHRATHESTLA